MVYKHTYRVSDTSLLVTLPADFKDKQVLVTIVDIPTVEAGKMALMKQAAQDPLYLSDMNEVNADFESIEHETL